MQMYPHPRAGPFLSQAFISVSKVQGFMSAVAKKHVHLMTNVYVQYVTLSYLM